MEVVARFGRAVAEEVGATRELHAVAAATS
jgi:hypothetical protein